MQRPCPRARPCQEPESIHCLAAVMWRNADVFGEIIGRVMPVDSGAPHSVLPQLGHIFAFLATPALHEGHRVGLETVERTFQTKKAMPPTTVMTIAKTMSWPGVHIDDHPRLEHRTKRLELRQSVRLLVTASASAFDPILELPSDFVERSVRRRLRSLQIAAVGRCVANDELVPWKPQVDGDAVAIPMAMMVTRQLDHDVARNDTVTMALELVRASLDTGGKLVRMIHRSERELKRHPHGSLPPLLSGAAPCNVALRCSILLR